MADARKPPDPDVIDPDHEHRDADGRVVIGVVIDEDEDSMRVRLNAAGLRWLVALKKHDDDDG
jgi:hypothetical protein